MLFEADHVGRQRAWHDGASVSDSGPAHDAALPASALEQAISLVGTVSAEGLEPYDIAFDLASLVRLRSAVDAAEARLIAQADRFGTECINAERVLRNAGCSTPVAKRSIRRSKMLEVMPRTAELLAAGEVTGEHADVLARAAEFAGAEAVEGSERLLAVAAAGLRTSRVQRRLLRRSVRRARHTAVARSQAANCYRRPMAGTRRPRYPLRVV